MLRYLGAFPVFRGEKDQWAMRHAQKVLEHRQVLAMFPEGSRSKGRGLRAGKTGVARLAIQNNCPILPVAVDGSHRMFRQFPRRTHIKITIGEPIYPHPGETTLGLTDRMMFTIADILPEELRGVYAKKPVGFN
jgi:1-acyl-sn-glycerol-3-phosphate acyltransferase